MTEQLLLLNDESIVEDEEMEHETNLSVRFTDEYRACEGGRPTAIVRRFGKVGALVDFKWLYDGEDHGGKTRANSPFDERTVLFGYDRGRSVWEALYGDDKQRLDEALLTDLAARCDLAAFLPPGKVKAGDTWEVEAVALVQLVKPAGELHMRTPGDDEGAPEKETERWRQYRQSFEGELTVTFTGTREELAVVVAVLGMVGQGKGAAQLDFNDGDGDPVEELNELGLKLEGEILWDVARGRPLSYRVEGDFRHTYRAETSWVYEDGEPGNQLLTRLFEGPARYGATWTFLD